MLVLKVIQALVVGNVIVTSISHYKILEKIGRVGWVLCIRLMVQTLWLT